VRIVKKITRGCWQIHVWGEAPQAPRGVVCTTVVLYNAETWTLKQEHQRKLRVFEVAVLRRICGVPRRDRKRNIDIINALDIDEDVVELLQKRRLTYFGHVSRMQRDTHTPSFMDTSPEVDLREDQGRSG